ncbi:hypothetical protein C5167_000157 [Papaver somniferum]|uniref:Small ribosomal subunit protein mS41 SAM domain-containing protein n=1 Tax=Papaver somniferum TaxID=3469 RepID=A0A4Y7KU91_PAPSO|nr:uncharacterized protein LOC113309252 [Papaver somniferum]RZC75972.1 hypothetical protein C5167_000157 [Papaver somniferum]
MATTLSRFIKKAASSSIPLANHHRNYGSAIFTTPLNNTITHISNLSRARISNQTQISSTRFFSKSPQYVEKVGIVEFLNGIGKGVETHIAKLESEIGDFHKLLVTRTLSLKKLGIPVKHRKLILKYTHKYRLGLWRPRADTLKA